jgi:hypothetical protein
MTLKVGFMIFSGRAILLLSFKDTAGSTKAELKVSPIAGSDVAISLQT